MRTIKKLHEAEYRPIADLETWSPVPTINLEQVDPFIFLNHHGPQVYTPHNSGLPFGPHPHRGMETVTFIIAGDIMHKDTGGHKSVITAGGVQWMTAGRGLIHSEVSSDEFKNKGGQLEILQLWLNLPADKKMTEPFYKGLQKDDIPTFTADEGRAEVQLISGELADRKGAFQSIDNVTLALIHFKDEAEMELNIPVDENIFFYVIRGALNVNNVFVESRYLAEFENDNEKLKIVSDGRCILLLGHARPLNEPVVAQGPFVMNTQEEITEAYRDYQEGKFGVWSE
jgi:quercetin 2,3-dioxygenase